MRTFAKSRIRYSKTQRIGIFAFIIGLVGLQIFGFFLNQNRPDTNQMEVPKEVLLLDQKLTNSSDQLAENKSFQTFDPNKLSVEEWQELGFSEKQVATIVKYKRSLGGYFSSKEEIKNCFVISEKKFAQIEPYIVFGDLTHYKSEKNFNSYNSTSNSPKSNIHYEKFNPNDYSQNDWERIGFSEKQATTILKYKKIVGGKFTSLEQIKKCYVISEEKFREIKPYLVFPVAKSQSTIEILEDEAKSSNSGTIELIEEPSFDFLPVGRHGTQEPKDETDFEQ